VKNRVEAYKSQMMNHIRLYVLTVFLFLSFTVNADFDSTLLLANQGDAAAQNQLGESYYKGKGVTKTDTESFERFKLAVAFKWFKLAADQGNANAQNHLGYMYEYGQHVTRNETEAVNWFRLAANQGLVSSQNHLGNMYYYGIGLSQSNTEAAKWYRLAADQGDTSAQSQLELLKSLEIESTVEISSKIVRENDPLNLRD
jgi:TPR repeat protein